jgi:hypothetical protein
MPSALFKGTLAQARQLRPTRTVLEERPSDLSTEGHPRSPTKSHAVVLSIRAGG